MRNVWGFLLVALAVCASSSAAQTVGASLQGTISDSAGAVIDSAKVKVRNIGTDAIKEIATDSAGRYHIPLLQPGEYEVDVSAQGFQVSTRRISLAVGQ